MDRDNLDAKDKLIEAGSELFAQKGFTGVSIRELSQAAATNSALISYYFGGKEGLYCAVLDYQWAPVETVLQDVMSQELPPLERILTYAKGVMKLHRERPYLIRFMYSELVTPTPAFEAILKKHLNSIVMFLLKTIRDGIAQGDFRSDIDAPHAALALAGIMNFYFITRPLNRQVFPGKEDGGQSFIIDALKIYLDGVKNHDK